MNEPEPSPARRRMRLLGLAVVAVCVLALAAGTFTLSYPGARATAVNAGVTGEMARVYPGILDAVLLVACAAALSLRGVWRVYAWLVTLVLIGTLAAADTTHALAIALPRRPMEVTVAVVPWVVLLVGLTLLDAMARQGRPSRKAVPPPGAGQPGTEAMYRNGVLPAHTATTVPLSTLLAHRSVAPPTITPAAQPPAHLLQPVHPPVSSPSPPPVTQPSPQPVTQPSPQPAAEPEQPQAGKLATVSPAASPEPSPPPLGGRDDPSDADAEPSEPSAFFGRLRKSLSPSVKPAKDGKQAPAEPPASQPAPSEPEASEPNASEPAPTEPEASEPKASEPKPDGPKPDEPEADKEPAGQSPNAETGS